MMTLAEKIAKRTMDGKFGEKEVTVITTSLTHEEVRERFLYRPHNRYSESKFGGSVLSNDRSLLLNEKAKRCKMCNAPTQFIFIKDGICPDCDGRAEYFNL